MHTNDSELEATCDNADRSNCHSLRPSLVLCYRADFLPLIIDWVLPCTPAVIYCSFLCSTADELDLCSI